MEKFSDIYIEKREKKIRKAGRKSVHSCVCVCVCIFLISVIAPRKTSSDTANQDTLFQLDREGIRLLVAKSRDNRSVEGREKNPRHSIDDIHFDEKSNGWPNSRSLNRGRNFLAGVIFVSIEKRVPLSKSKL